MTSASELSEKIITLLKQRKTEGMRKSDLRRQLGLTHSSGVKHFREAFRELVTRGAVVGQRGGRYLIADSANLVAGTLSVHPRGFGFVTRGDGEPDIFIPPKGMHTAISGDRVLVAIADTADERGPSGFVRKIVERKHEHLTGQLVELEGRFYVRPLRRALPEIVPLRGDKDGVELQGATPGDWIAVQLCPRESPREPLQALVVQHLGTGQTIAGDLDAIVNEYQLEAPYTPAQNDAAVSLPLKTIERENIEALCVVTIDPEDAKDFDDALSVEAGNDADTMIVGVHIADVAAFISPGSEFDQEACKRVFTAYLPGRTLPMLPNAIASDKCSLLEGQSRPAHSVFLKISKSTGEILSFRRAHTLIKVSKRLSFSEVQEFLDDKSEPDWPPAVSTTLNELGLLHQAMRRRRAADEVFLNLCIPEIRVRYEENPPRVTGLFRKEPAAAHALVEEFMLAANSAVASELQQKELPGLFRVHNDPKSADLDEFSRWVASVAGRRPRDVTERKEVNHFVEELAKSPLRDVILYALLSAMQRATYAAQPGIHYGLGKTCYCHFTSPIRRYPDLLVHQQLFSRDHGLPERDIDECEVLARQCSVAEKNNDDAYYATIDRLKLRYVKGLVQEDRMHCYEGIVARAVSDGLIIYLSDLGMYGMLSIKMLGDEPFMFERELLRLKGRRSGKIHKCGDFMVVQIRKTDIVKGVLQLQPVSVRV